MSHKTIVQPSRNGQHAGNVVKTSDPEVVPKAERQPGGRLNGRRSSAGSFAHRD